MNTETTKVGIGTRVYGAGIMALGLITLFWADFIEGQPVPKHFPGRTILAFGAGAFTLVAGAAIQWRRTVAGAAAALTAYFALVVAVLMNLPVVLAHYAVYGAYFGVAEQLSLATGALIVYAAYAGISRSLAARLSRIGQIAFGVCTLFFGGAHFIYMNLTAPLVPKWLPPNQVFWGYATGLAFLAAGASLVTRLYCRLAAILLAVMLALFALLVHAPMLLVDRSRANWTEAAINFAILAVAWVMADALVAPRPPTSTDSGRATSPADGQ